VTARDSFQTPIRIRENAFSDPANFARIVKFRKQHVSCDGIVHVAWSLYIGYLTAKGVRKIV